MKPFSTRSATLAAAFALGIGFAPVASAVATYDATASLTLTLTSVLDASGAPSTDFLVQAEGIVQLLDATTTGSASAVAMAIIVDPAVVLDIDDSVTQTSRSLGSATDGTAESISLTDLNVYMQNNSSNDLTFTFSYAASATATVTGSAADGDVAGAFALVRLFDIENDLIPRTEALTSLFLGPPLSDSDQRSGSIGFTLGAQQNFSFFAYVDSQGSAEAVPPAVPEPTTLALFGLGLAGLGAVRRKKLAA